MAKLIYKEKSQLMPGDTIKSIGHQYNFDNVYLRMVTVALGKTLNRRIRWINYFKDEKRCLSLPFNYRMFGQERFLLDSYLDDITDTRVELNTDQIPRGIITLTTFNSVTDEFANPNIYIPKDSKIHNEWKRIITKVKAIPMQLNFDVEILLDDVRDVWVCSEKILMLFFNYFFFNMDYFGIKIDLVLQLPDDRSIEVPTAGDFTSDKKKIIKFPLTVRGYYPVWTVDTDNVECYNEEFENIKRVYWQDYIHDYQSLREKIATENVNDPEYQQSDPRTTTNIEDFSTGGNFKMDNPNYDKTGNVSASDGTSGYSEIPPSKWIGLNDNLFNFIILSFVTTGNRVIAGTNNGIYYNDNLINGRNWISSNSGLSYVYSLMIDNYNNIYAGTSKGLYLSMDNGVNWNDVYSGFDDKNIFSVMRDGNNLYVGAEEGVYLSIDSGISWGLKNSGLSYTVYSISAINGSIFAGANNGVYMSSNNGDSWISILDKGGKNNLITEGNVIIVGNDATGIYSASLDNLSRWDNGKGLRNPYILSLSMYDGKLYAGTVEGLYVSDDGRLWSVVDVLTRQVLSELVFNGYIFAGTDRGIYKYKI